MAGELLSSEPGAGLAGLVAHASREAAGEQGTPVGVLEIELERDAASNLPRVAVEAAFAQQGGRRVVERLGVRVGIAQSQAPDAALARRALGDFGGTGFTNVCVSHPMEPLDASSGPYRVADAGAPRGEFEAIDLTVSFPSRLSWYARNDAILPESESSADLDACVELLERLGVKHHRRDGRLVIARRQLRRPLSVEAQLEALLAPAARGLHVAIFASSLPPRRTARLELTPRPGRGPGAHDLDCCLIRGLYTFGGAARTSTAVDALAIQEFVKDRFSLEFGDKRWRLHNVHADRPQLRFGVIPRRR